MQLLVLVLGMLLMARVTGIAGSLHLQATAKNDVIDVPTAEPTEQPTETMVPSEMPTEQPTELPTSSTPTVTPTMVPTVVPSEMPTEQPTESKVPSEMPTAQPTEVPTSSTPTVTPTMVPTEVPSEIPSLQPTETPTITPSVTPTEVPSEVPTTSPTTLPTEQPTVEPTSDVPTHVPTIAPTMVPTEVPSEIPSLQPTVEPTSDVPTHMPTIAPSMTPTEVPSEMPSLQPTVEPTSDAPTIVPTIAPSVTPTEVPSTIPTLAPSNEPTIFPSTAEPSYHPTHIPSEAPSEVPTHLPTDEPSTHPSDIPTCKPTEAPSTAEPSNEPTQFPSTADPTVEPTIVPTLFPSRNPSFKPSPAPTQVPTISFEPTSSPTKQNEPIVSWKSSLLIENVDDGTLSDAARTSIQNATALGMGVLFKELEFVSDFIVVTASRVSFPIIVHSSNVKNFMITFETTVSMNSYPYRDADEVYTVLVGNLNKSINDNTFDEYLQSSSRINGATALYHSNCTNAQYSRPTVDHPKVEPSSGNDALTAGAISGIVFGFIAAIAIIYFGIQLYHKRRGNTDAAFQRWQTHVKNAFDPANVTPNGAPTPALSQMHTGVELNTYLEQYGDPTAVHSAMTPIQTTPDMGLNPMISAERHRSMVSPNSSIPLNQYEMQTLERLQNLERIRLQQLNTNVTTSPLAPHTMTSNMNNMMLTSGTTSPHPPPPPPSSRARKDSNQNSVTPSATPGSLVSPGGEARQIAVPFALPGMSSPAQAALRRASLNPLNAIKRPESVRMQQSNGAPGSGVETYAYSSPTVGQFSTNIDASSGASQYYDDNQYGTSSTPFQQGHSDISYGSVSSPMSEDTSQQSISSRSGGAGRGGRGGGANIAAMARRKSQVGILQGVSHSAVALSQSPTTPSMSIDGTQDASPPSRDRRSQRYK